MFTSAELENQELLQQMVKLRDENERLRSANKGRMQDLMKIKELTAQVKKLAIALKKCRSK